MVSSPTPPTDTCDVLVVGGGINGVGIARDLAGRGVGVMLCERDDLAQHTSSASTKLIHGGLRYLQYGEFGLVRKALAEREVLLRSAPHIIRPLRFVLPHDARMRPAWLIRIGLFLYDHLARRELLPGSGMVKLASHPAGAPLRAEYQRAFVYSDGWVDDARLVVLNAMDAARRGAKVLTRCECVSARRIGGKWEAVLRHADGSTRTVEARTLVNAAGPWAASFLKDRAGQCSVRSLRLVKGSHIVVPRLFDHDHAYIFQNPDGRVIFAIPYEERFTLIGTTDVEHGPQPGVARIDPSEIDYLCTQASRYFDKPVRPADVVWTFSGIRPLLDDDQGSAAAVTRDYLLEFDVQDGAPLMSVWGGKITTYRKLAEEAADQLAATLGLACAPWTRKALLPGSGTPARLDAWRMRHPAVPEGTLQRWARCDVSLIDDIIAKGGLGAEVLTGLYEAELRYLHEHEWARTTDDVLWRRTKLGLHLTAAQQAQLQSWWTSRCEVRPATAAATHPLTRSTP